MASSEPFIRVRVVSDLRQMLGATSLVGVADMDVDHLWDALDDLLRSAVHKVTGYEHNFTALIAAGAVARLLRLALDIVNIDERREESQVRSKNTVGDKLKGDLNGSIPVTYSGRAAPFMASCHCDTILAELGNRCSGGFPIP